MRARAKLVLIFYYTQVYAMLDSKRTFIAHSIVVSHRTGNQMTSFRHLSLYFPSRILGFLIVLALLPICSLQAVPKRAQYGDDSQTAIREMRDSLEDLRHLLSNQDAELKMLQEKISNQDSTVEALRQQVVDAHQAHKDQLKGNANTLESKLSQLENLSKTLSADLKLLKDHINDTAGSVDQQSQRLVKIEKGFEQLSQNARTMESATNSLMEALQVKAAVSSKGDSKAYKVKSGDSLGKIAQEQKTTLKTLRELNPHLTNDKIVVGQTLQIP